MMIYKTYLVKFIIVVVIVIRTIKNTVWLIDQICRVSHNFGRILLDDDPQKNDISREEKMSYK